VKKLLSVFLFVLLVGVMFSACTGQSKPATAELPAGKAWAEGKEIYFVHTEASDAEVATLLTKMMASPVLLVPGLKNVPDSTLANVYVFDNGLKGMGPLGFQADVFDNPPGTSGYSPLRRLHIVSWIEPAKARLLTSVDEITAAQEAGEVTVNQPGVVINMPFVVWENGKR
jgi:hypothetical protein